MAQLNLIIWFGLEASALETNGTLPKCEGKEDNKTHKPDQLCSTFQVSTYTSTRIFFTFPSKNDHWFYQHGYVIIP